MLVTTAFVVGLLCQIMMISSGFRLDKNLPTASLYFRKSLQGSWKKYFFFQDKYRRDDFLVYGVILQILSYLLIYCSFILFLYAIITQNENTIFFSAVFSFALATIGTIQAIVEMVLAFIEEIKKDRRDDDF